MTTNRMACRHREKFPYNEASPPCHRPARSTPDRNLEELETEVAVKRVVVGVDTVLDDVLIRRESVSHSLVA